MRNEISNILNKNYGVVISVDNLCGLYIDSIAPIHEIDILKDMKDIKANIISSINTNINEEHGKSSMFYIKRRKAVDNTNLSLYHLKYHLYSNIIDTMTQSIYEDIKNRRIVSIYGTDKCDTYVFIFNIENVI